MMVADCWTSHSIYGRTLRVYGRILLTFLLSLLVSGCDLLFGTTINYRVEATVLVHGKPYTGSSVWSMTLKRIVGLVGVRSPKLSAWRYMSSPRWSMEAEKAAAFMEQMAAALVALAPDGRSRLPSLPSRTRSGGGKTFHA